MSSMALNGAFLTLAAYARPDLYHRAHKVVISLIHQLRKKPLQVWHGTNACCFRLHTFFFRLRSDLSWLDLSFKDSFGSKRLV
jgi:hypothetical protein